ncbi:amidohydrolase family protein [Actinophytocola sp.]|uniref:amidohydrolase family protein n=1 Tax=Actinophytocola sp. TaxID=1872138 RepID=UPI002EDA0D8B
MLIVDAEVAGRTGVGVRVADGRVVASGAGLRPVGGESVLEAHGGALLPGLHDHHVHLRAMAGALASVPVGPPVVRDRSGLVAALLSASAGLSAGEWVRAVGYHESVAGPLTRVELDAVVADRPVRVQHRSGVLWMLNSLALQAVDAAGSGLSGVERDDLGRPTGRLFRLDSWLASRLPRVAMSLAAVGDRAAAAGITGFTEATSDLTQSDVDFLASGGLPQRVHCMAPPGVVSDRLPLGPVKVLLDDSSLPSVGVLAARFYAAHTAGRPVAVHCMTVVELVATLSALAEAGSVPGDRIEHGAVIPADLIPRLRSLVVVTQPGFIAERGDTYLAEVDGRDIADLWRLRSLLDAGVPVAGSTDAPFGHFDPWAAIAAATSRRTTSGVVVGPDERLDPERALGLFLGHASAPARPRAVEVGAPADLCLLAVPLAEGLRILDATMVAATVVAGRVVHSN